MQYAEAVFSHLDRDGDGVISAADFKAAVKLHRLHEKLADPGWSLVELERLIVGTGSNATGLPIFRSLWSEHDQENPFETEKASQSSRKTRTAVRHAGCAISRDAAE